MKEKLGTCYQDALNYFLDNHRKKSIVLVHGIVTGQRKIAGVLHGHAWIEEGEMVISPSQDPILVVPRDLYYALGNITTTFKYASGTVMEKMCEHGTYGPWEKELWAEGIE